MMFATFLLFMALGFVSLSEAVAPQGFRRSLPSFRKRSISSRLSHYKKSSSKDEKVYLESSHNFLESETHRFFLFIGPNLMISRPWLSFLLGSGLVISSKCRRSEAVCRALYFWRHAGPIVFHYKFTQKWIGITNPEPEKRDKIYKALHDRYCSSAVDLILHLRGLYAKIGQVLSSRPDFMPPQYIEKFSVVQDSIPQWPIESVKSIVQKSLESEHGLGWDDIFESMEPIALGSASIGQVHRAVLKRRWTDEDKEYTGGEVVAVKIMHPGAQSRFKNDFQVFRWLTRVALPNWTPWVEELERRLMNEFDYRNEADNLSRVRDNIAKSPYRKRVYVPQPMKSLCSKEVLIMEILNGKKLSEAFEDKISSALGGNKEVVSKLMEKKKRELMGDRTEEDTYTANASLLEELEPTLWTKVKLFLVHRKITEYIDLLMDVHGYQIFIDGCYNGDPHPGNIMELEDGKTLGLIDFGQTRTVNDEDRLGVARVVAALGGCGSNNDSNNNVEQVAEYMRNLGFQTKRNDDVMLHKYATLLFDSDVAGRKLGYATPQLYFKSLTDADPLVNIPDSVVFIARVSILFRGVAAIINKPMHTSSYWSKHANDALERA